MGEVRWGEVGWGGVALARILVPVVMGGDGVWRGGSWAGCGGKEACEVGHGV